MPGPLNGVTVLDLTHFITGPYATKLLADYGADVIKIEPAGGDPARQLPPFKDDRPDPELSGTFFYFNTNKRSVVVDLKREEGREVFGRLLERSDVVLESFRPGTLERLGVGWDFIRARKPSLPLVSVSNFGQQGPYRDYKGSDLVLYGYAGEMYSMGTSDREPVKMYGTAALVESGSAAALAAMGALMIGVEQGVGQHVDFAISDSHFGGVDRRHAWITAYEFAGHKGLRQIGAAGAAGSTIYPCADGYVELTAIGLRMDRLSEMLGDPEWLQDPMWQRAGILTDPDAAGQFQAGLIEWLMPRTKREVWEAARQARVLCGPLFTVEELFDDPHFQERGFWATVEHEALGTVQLTGRPFIMPESPWELRRPAPLLGEHTCEVLAEAGYAAGAIEALAASGAIGVR